MPNRFVVHARLEDTGEEAVAHMADPGRLSELQTVELGDVVPAI